MPRKRKFVKNPEFREEAYRSSARAVAYLRTSTDEQTLGLDAQREEISLWAAVNKVHISKFFTDQCSGALDFDVRPAWKALLEYRYQQSCEYIVAARRDRFARDMYLLTREERRLLPAGVQLLTAQETAEMHVTPERQMIRGVVGVMAEYERELLRDRTKKALAQLKAQGVKLGRPQWITRENNRKHIAERITQWKKEGRSLRWMTMKLNEGNVGGRKWHLTQVARAVKYIEEYL